MALGGFVLAVTASRPILARVCMATTLASGVFAIVILGVAFVSNDWTNEYVADHSRSGLPWTLRLAGMWAGAEGSLLLWTVLTGFAGAIAVRLAGSGGRGDRERTFVHGGHPASPGSPAGHVPPIAAPSRRVGTFGSNGDGVIIEDPTARTVTVVRRVVGVTVGSYALVVAALANPFDQLLIPAIDGLGLQPVLEHPAMVWHPPILYAGLIGLLIPAFLAVGLVVSGRPLRVPQLSIALPLSLLTIGLVSGARWAHVELGWGGFWAWDVVESAGLVAWLFGISALHLVRTKSRPLVMYISLILPAVASVWATTITRTGIISSIHSFAERPVLSRALMAVAVGSTIIFGLAAVRAGVGQASRWSARRSGSSVLGMAALVVAIGTYQPALELLFRNDSIAVGGQFFARVLFPVVLAGMALIVNADRKIAAALVGSVLGALITPISAGPFGIALGMGAGAVVVSSLAVAAAGRRGAIAHVGAGLFLLGVAGTIASTVDVVLLEKDQPAEVAGMTVTHLGLELSATAVTDGVVASVSVNGEVMAPRLVFHRLRGISTAEAANSFSIGSERQIVLLSGTDGEAVYRVIEHPRIGLVWLGGTLVALGVAGQLFRRFFRLFASRRPSVASSVDPSEPAESGSPSTDAGSPVAVDESVPRGG